jgi:RND family efflux transporter MFP subunit
MELFRLVQTAPFRMYVDVPQSYMRSVEEGMEAQVLAREHPGRIFAGEVVRTSGAIDPVSRTLRVEIELPNENQELLPGMYAEVKLVSTAAASKLRVPSTAVLFGAKGPAVALVDLENRVRIKKVELGRDFGTEIEVASGLTKADLLVANPTDALTDGMKVSIKEKTKRLAAKS